MDNSQRKTRRARVSITRRPIAIAAVFAAALLLVAIGARSRAASPTKAPAIAAKKMTPSNVPAPGADPTPAMQNAIVPSRSHAMRMYPCSDCHGDEGQKGDQGNGSPSHPQIELAHLPNSQDCFVCHDPMERDKLILVTGKHVEFDHVQDLCGQCHMSKRRDWARGIHGKQVGSWSGLKHRYACTDCHDAHTPAIGPMKAMPAPAFPKFGIRKHPNAAPGKTR